MAGEVEENFVKPNAVRMSAPRGPTILFVRRRRRRAEVDWSCFSREVVRVVRDGWMTRVAAKERWAGDGTKAGVLGFAEAEDEERREMRRLNACV